MFLYGTNIRKLTYCSDFILRNVQPASNHSIVLQKLFYLATFGVLSILNEAFSELNGKKRGLTTSKASVHTLSSKERIAKIFLPIRKSP